ncbi:type II toxin-antitoxin system RelE/ParE family toxin [uncultured Parasphingorhabdus sp.]|uniref:type II toxin-antitoxin system RelE/ParE family toxin n=1 Tax=uncultured Parasphingorhabdus sp. TaxID=2709694 RepID=UPI002AA837D9|nr:type II toxin-antitoxin system RelE/ParE family toxin [uncultured Parasphingorhabdus sp.]
MTWDVEFHVDFESEFAKLDEAVQDELLAMAGLLEIYGPQLGRPHADTLSGSRHGNMKELRFNAADGVWRVAFAFDPERKAMILIAGDKSGGSQKRFYKNLINKADKRFDAHLAALAKKEN